MAQNIDNSIAMQTITDSRIATQKSEPDSWTTRDGTMDYKGKPAIKSTTGGVKVLPFIFGSEFADRSATNGISLNIISYLLYVKHMHLPDAANLITNYIGSSSLLALLGGFVADTYLGRFWTIVLGIIFEMLGVSLLVVNSTLDQFRCLDPKTCPPAHGADLALIYLAVYLLAIGGGCIKSSASPFGADQFEKEDPNEAKFLPHFFNWFFFMIAAGALVGATFLVYLQNRSWPWGFGSVVLILVIALILLLACATKYRYKIPMGSPFTALAKVFIAAIKNRKLPRPTGFVGTNQESGFYDVIRPGTSLKVVQTNNMRWLDKAAIVPEGMTAAQRGDWLLTTVTDVENFKLVLRLLPVLATTWLFWTLDTQFITFTVSQAITSNRNLGPNFQVPPASIGAMKTISVLVILVLYDKVFLPFTRKQTGHPSGITALQRIGVGLALSILSMICAALVERRRLQEVHDLNWELKPTIPMKSFSMFWYVPQYAVLALGESFLYPGQIDFFYTQAPENMQAVGTSLCLATLAIGSFGSSVVVSAVNSISSPHWIQNNINISRLDKYFWLLAALAGLNLVAFVLVARFHKYKITKVPDSSSSLDEEGQDQPTKPQEKSSDSILHLK